MPAVWFSDVRRFSAIAFATALEVASDPLALLLTLGALALAAVSPSVHYHQFGEPSRMARDAGLSALLFVGLCHVVFLSVKSFRREIESGTMQIALAHSVSRASFFCAKLCGVFSAYLLFALTVSSVALTMVKGTEIAGEISERTGRMVRVWGPSFAISCAAIVLPPAIAAVLNRFARFRFTATATVSAAVVATASAAYRFDPDLAGRVAPAALMIILPAAVFAAAASAAAVRWRANGALTACGLLAAVSLPLLGGYYMSDALSHGGSLPWRHVVAAAVATAPAVAAFALCGVTALEGRDICADE